MRGRRRIGLIAGLLLALVVLVFALRSEDSLEGASLRGHVFDEETGLHVSGALVSAGNRKTTTDAEGAFELLALPAGQQGVTVVKSGYLRRVAPAVAPGAVQIGLRAQADGKTGDYEGIGLMMDFGARPDGGVGYPIVQLHPEGGARVAGLLPGDQVLAAEGVAAGTLPHDRFNEILRGAEGTIVKLTVRRDGRVFDVNVVRRRLVW